MKRWLAVILILGALMGRIPPVLRLHVVANSDTKADQDVKLLVRDAVMAYYQDRLLTMEGFGQAEAYMMTQLDTVKDVADCVLISNGMLYQSRVCLGTATFPEKSYDGLVFPAGQYHALNIVLGDGEGQNWWCVLFPPLCLLHAEQVDESWQPQDGVTYKSWFATLWE